MKHILPIVLLGEIDVVEEEGEVLEHPLGQVHVDGGAHQEAHVEHRLTHLVSRNFLRLSNFCYY